MMPATVAWTVAADIAAIALGYACRGRLSRLEHWHSPRQLHDHTHCNDRDMAKSTGVLADTCEQISAAGFPGERLQPAGDFTYGNRKGGQFRIRRGCGLSVAKTHPAEKTAK